MDALPRLPIARTRRALLALALRASLRPASAVAIVVASLGLAATPLAQGGRPKVGLALSGGGARGAAHVGVLRVLEELHVPIDYVAGTSMGAIVGGLYASGLAPDEIGRRLEETDWSLALVDETKRELLPFRRKQDDRRFRVDFELGFRPWRLILPKGLLQGQKLGLILRTMTLHVADVRDFDELYVPFRAVAADIVTGDLVVMRDGSLATAMRASMSVPGVFAPVQRDGRTLVDGGIARNLPVDVVREMGADIVIAVDISTPLGDENSVVSLLGISGQMISILMRENTLRQKGLLGEDDVLIVPDLGTIEAADFHRVADAVEVGDAAARAIAETLAPLGIDAAEYVERVSARDELAGDLPRIRHIDVENDSNLADAGIRDKLTVKEGERVDPTALAGDISRIYGLGVFERIEYDLVDGADDEADLLIRATEKSWGPSYMQFALNLEHDFEGDNAFGLGVSDIWHPVNSLGAEWRNEIEMGSVSRVFSEFYQPLDHGQRWFVAPSIEYVRQDIGIFLGGSRVAEFERSSIAYTLAFGRQFSNWGEARIGVRKLEGEARLITGDPAIGNVDFEQGSGFFSAAYDTFDSSTFPRFGTQAKLDLGFFREALGSDEDFDTLRFNAQHAHSWGPDTINAAAGLATNLDENAPVQSVFPIGGFLNVSGLNQFELFGNHVALARLLYYRELGRQEGVPFNSPLYAGGSLELGGAFDTRGDINERNALWAGSAFVALDTFLGPIFLAYGLAEGGSRALTLFVGTI